MTAVRNRDSVVVTSDCEPSCPSHHVTIAYHHDFPETRGRGESPERAAADLLRRLDSDLEYLANDRQRMALRHAIDEVHAFLRGNS